MNENVYRFIGGLIVAVGAGISTSFRRRADRRSGGEQIPLKDEGLPLMLALRLAGIALWLSVFVYLLNPGWMAWSAVKLPEALRWAGVVLGLLSDGLIFWVFSSLGNNVTSTVGTRSRHVLVTSGPYRWIRHPLYSVGFVSYMAFALLAANWFIASLAVVVLFVLSLRVPKEEAALIAENGQVYLAYAKRTGRFLPRLG
jgi:protein-S-isoprenylcysteine O-methyltransferase Ste14